MEDEKSITEAADSVPALIRREITTAASEQSIWKSVQDEAAFRQAAVDLALTTSECPWDADIGLSPCPGAPCIDDYVGIPQPHPEKQDRYILSEQIEHRLANDFALIAASKEAVFSVTAACIEERMDVSSNLASLKLWLAANEGVSEELKGCLLDIWNCLSARISEAEILEKVFTKIVHLNRLRIYQRVRKAVGHPPIFREKGRTRQNPDDRLSRAFTRMCKSKLTEQGHALVERGLAANIKLLALLEELSVEDVEAGSEEATRQLKDISQACFNVTTDNGRLPFKHILVESGLDARLWLKSKYVGEVDKIGAYWRMAMSMVRIHSHMSRGRPHNISPIKLEIEGVQPYVSVTRDLSIQGRPMSCYVHAEVQLITHLALKKARADIGSPSVSKTIPSQPRFIGASKSACFLCFLFLTCYGGPKAPPTHGRLYDQWTVPDLVEYTPTHADRLRQTLKLMHTAMIELRQDYCLKKARDHPMTSRVDIDRLSLFTTISDTEAKEITGDTETVSQRDAGILGTGFSGPVDCAGCNGSSEIKDVCQEAGSCPGGTKRCEEPASPSDKAQKQDLRAFLEKCMTKLGI